MFVLNLFHNNSKVLIAKPFIYERFCCLNEDFVGDWLLMTKRVNNYLFEMNAL